MSIEIDRALNRAESGSTLALRSLPRYNNCDTPFSLNISPGCFYVFLVHGLLPGSSFPYTLFGLCSDFVRELFGLSSEKGGVFRTTPEQLPNNSRTKPEETSNQIRTRYEPGTKVRAVSCTKITLHFRRFIRKELYSTSLNF